MKEYSKASHQYNPMLGRTSGGLMILDSLNKAAGDMEEGEFTIRVACTMTCDAQLESGSIY